VKNRTLFIVIGAVGLVVALAGLAVLLTGGDDQSGGVLAPGETALPPVEVEQNRPVEVDGAPAPRFESGAPNDAALGTAFPTVTGQTFDGRPVTIGGSTNGPTLVVYLAHWCPHCNAEIPEIIEVDERGGFPDDLTILGVSTGVDNTAPNYPPSNWLADKQWRYRTLADSADSEAFLYAGGSGFPFLVLLDSDGNILARASGQKPADQLEAWVSDALTSAAA
jgi:thiol-disulfide isomerase/thioredoxin